MTKYRFSVVINAKGLKEVNAFIKKYFAENVPYVIDKIK